LLFNKQGLGAREVLFYWSRYLIFYFVPSCHVLVSLPFISYLTNKHLVQRRFHFTSQGTCFLNFIPSGHVLVYLPFICYLTTRTWGIGGAILLVKLFNLFYFVRSCSLWVSLHFICYLTINDLGHWRFHFIGHDACFFFLFSLFTILFFIWFPGVLFWFPSPSFLI
jgi:hypothetical protein